MVVAANLLDAAGKTQANLFTLWQASTLQARMLAFWTDANPIFPGDVVNNQPVKNWIGVIAAFTPSILAYVAAAPPLVTYQQSVQYIYRICKLANANNVSLLITNAQAAALLAAYNLRFG